MSATRDTVGKNRADTEICRHAPDMGLLGTSQSLVFSCRRAIFTVLWEEIFFAIVRYEQPKSHRCRRLRRHRRRLFTGTVAAIVAATAKAVIVAVVVAAVVAAVVAVVAAAVAFAVAVAHSMFDRSIAND